MVLPMSVQRLLDIVDKIMFKRILIAVIICALALGGIVTYNRVCDVDQQLRYMSLKLVYGLPIAIQEVSPSVVYVKAYSEYGDWSGSGVIVGPHTVLTAKHVIRDAGDLVITTINGDEYEATSYIVDPNNDCGLLFFEEELGPVVKFADKLSLGEKVFIVGSPFGYNFFNTVTAGIVSGFGRSVFYFAEDLMITVDAASSPGNSGGPVFNMQGRVIGILVGGKYGNDDFSILISVGTCKRLLEYAKEIWVVKEPI